MSAETPLVSILAVTCDREAELRRCLTAALSQSYGRTEVVVVDNSSRDGAARLIAERFGGVRLVRAPRNLGPAAGRNLGFRHCRGKYVYILDDDAWPAETAVDAAVARAETDETIGVVASRYEEIRDGQVVRVVPRGDAPAYQTSFSGCCALIRRAAFEAAGGFPEDFFRNAEESDLAIRMLDAGSFCFVEPASVAYHALSPSRRDDAMNAYYHLRNSARTGLRLWPFPWCLLKAAVTFGRAVRLAVRWRKAWLPLRLAVSLLRDVVLLPATRKPVRRDTLRVWLRLLDRPSETRPSFGARGGAAARGS